MPPITVTHKLVPNPDFFFQSLDDLDWVRIGSTPRDEYYVNDVPNPYTYGTGAGQRTYHPQRWTDELRALQRIAEAVTRSRFEACFLNRYKDGRDQLNWHADDSPEMDDARPIVIMSLGAEREIWFRARGDRATEPHRVAMQSGTMIVMHSGMQDTHEHRIPKSGRQDCGPRISLTFRGYVG